MTRITVISAIIALSTGMACAQTVSPPKSLQLTVYNGNFALVKDVRTIDLKPGVNSIEVEDVASQIDPTSVLFKSLTAPNSVSILEQNYQYDLISPDNILRKSVGQRATFKTFDQEGKPHSYSGTVMNPPAQPLRGGYHSPTEIWPVDSEELIGPGYVIRTDDGSLVLNPRGQVSLAKMPNGLHPKPTLNWLLKSGKSGKQDAEISYITNGLSWNADYVALVNADDNRLDLAGWVTMNNQSGATYPNAKLTLMAGDVRRTESESYAWGGVPMSAADPRSSQFQEKSFFEYHMYTMGRPTSIRDKETKQLSLLTAADVPTAKEMIYDGRGDWWRKWWYPGRTDFSPGSGYDTSNYHKVNVVLRITNSVKNHMGMPLPKGRVSVYKLDDTGSEQFVGEDNIDHTPRDETIRLHVGDAFDVVGDYKRTDYKNISDDVMEESFETSIRNHKDEPVIVKAVDHVWADWTVTAKSHDFSKRDAQTIEFPISVPANGETKVTYTIRTNGVTRSTSTRGISRSF